MIRRAVLWRLERIAATRQPDAVIGDPHNPYLLRWHIIPRNRLFNIYFHHFQRSDDDRALHDHPWWNFSWLLEGEYLEHTPAGIWHRVEGAMVLRRSVAAHRIQLMRPIPYFHRRPELPVRTLFMTGPKIREWGFHCPKGWRHWKDFTRPGAEGQTGAGCD